MRLREITETKQLNEVAPLAFLAPMLPPALAWISTAGLVQIALWAVSAVGAWMTGQEIKKAIDANGSNPANWPPELQDDLLGQIIGTALFASLPALKPVWQKAWSNMPKNLKSLTFQKVAPVIEKEIAKSPGAMPKDPNRIEKPFSKDAPVKDPNRIEKPFSKGPDAVSPANAAAPAPKNPNLVDRPFQKEELLRLAGLAK